jgi:hypothetical protein
MEGFYYWQSVAKRFRFLLFSTVSSFGGFGTLVTTVLKWSSVGTTVDGSVPVLTAYKLNNKDKYYR